MSLTAELELVAAALAARRGPDARRAVEEQLARLRETGLAQAALRVAELAPDFELPDVASGRTVSLTRLLDRGPVVVNFVRGFWCPYCNLQMRALARAEQRLAALGATLLAITAQPLESALNGIAVSPLPYPLLHDAGGRIATLFGIAFPVSPDLARIYELSGIPTTRNRDGETILPLPASYVIARDGTVTYAFVDVDYTRRAEPEALVAAVEGMRVQPGPHS
jgi:peroxiredoxin